MADYNILAAGNSEAFQDFFGFDRLWIRCMGLAELATIIMRVIVVRIVGHERDQVYVNDMIMGIFSFLILNSMSKAVQSGPFVKIYREYGDDRHHGIHVIVVKAMVVVNLFRPLLPLIAFVGNSDVISVSHTGGFFLASVGSVFYVYSLGTCSMCKTAAKKVILEIQSNMDDGKWGRVMNLLINLKADFEKLWTISSASLPFLLVVIACGYGAYYNGLEFMSDPADFTRAIFFLAFVVVGILVLKPLASITSTCSSTALSPEPVRAIPAAATKFYCPTAAEGYMKTMDPREWQSYLMVVRFLDQNRISVYIVGFRIDNRFLQDLAMKALLGLPAAYKALVTIIRQHYE